MFPNFRVDTREGSMSDDRAGMWTPIVGSLLEQPKIVFPCHPDRFHIIQDNRHRYLIVPGNHNRTFCGGMMKYHMIPALAYECTSVHFEYPDLCFPVRGEYFRTRSLKTGKNQGLQYFAIRRDLASEPVHRQLYHRNRDTDLFKAYDFFIGFYYVSFQDISGFTQ